jgi:hypothetical protein
MDVLIFIGVVPFAANKRCQKNVRKVGRKGLILFERMRSLTGDQLPVGRMDAVVCIFLVLFEPGSSADQPISSIHVEA